MTQHNLALSLHDLAPLKTEAQRRMTLDLAVAAYRTALTVSTRETAPADWAMTQNNLAVALSDRAGVEAELDPGSQPPGQTPRSWRAPSGVLLAGQESVA